MDCLQCSDSDSASWEAGSGTWWNSPESGVFRGGSAWWDELPASCSHRSAGNGCPLWFSVSWVPGWSLPCVLNVLHVPRADKDLFHTRYTIVDLLRSLTKTWSAALAAGSHSFPICFGRNRISLNDSNKVLCDNCGRGWPCLGPCASRRIRITWNNALVGFRKLGFKVLLVICDIQIAFNLNSETDVQDGWGVGRGGILGTILESHAAVKCPLTPESVMGLFLYTQTLPQTQERAQEMVHLRPLYFCLF